MDFSSVIIILLSQCSSKEVDLTLHCPTGKARDPDVANQRKPCPLLTDWFGAGPL